MKETITSLQNKIVKEVYSLKDNKNIKEKHMFLVETMHLVEMAKDNLEYVLTLNEIPSISCKQYIVNKEILEKCSNNKSYSKVIGVVKQLEFEFVKEDTLVYLDNIQDPGNLGTILRTCLALNIKNIIVSKDCCSIYNLKAIQSSEGALFKVNIKVGDISLLKNLKEEGYRIVSTSLSKDSILLNNLEYKQKTVFVFGNEGNGVRSSIIELSDNKVIIPINNIDSLNVGVSLGIVLYTYLFNIKSLK